MIHRSSPNTPGALASVPALARSMRMSADGTSGHISSSLYGFGGTKLTAKAPFLDSAMKTDIRLPSPPLDTSRNSSTWELSLDRSLRPLQISSCESLKLTFQLKCPLASVKETGQGTPCCV